MKIKAAMLICALFAVMFAFAGCADKKDNTSGSGTTSTTTTTTATSLSDMATDDGEYEAGEDGVVTDDHADTSAPEADPF